MILNKFTAEIAEHAEKKVNDAKLLTHFSIVFIAS